MTFLYQLAVLGDPTNAQIDALSESVASALGKLDLRLGHEVGWEISPTAFKPHQLHPSAAVFFAGNNTHLANLEELLARGIPVIPVISDVNQDKTAMPEILRPIHPVSYSDGGAEALSTALLGCVGLVPQQRRVFISYCRDEAAEAASQLFEALTARQFDVFLDSHSNGPIQEVDALSWQRLYDSDVLLMLDTPTYFESRWTSAAFGRVLAKGISVLRVSWPGATPSPRSGTASRTELLATDIQAESGQISEDAMKRICLQLEEVRSQNYAVRWVNLMSSIRISIETIGGKMLGVSRHKAVHLQLASGEQLTVYPTVGVPTPVTLQEAFSHSPDNAVAVVYDPIGLHANGVVHLDWLKNHQEPAKWIKATDASHQFEQWEH